MYTAITILIVIASILLIFFVLVQNSKGGGLASNFSSSNQIMGVRKTTDFLEKATWGLVIAVVVLSIATVPINKKTVVSNDSQIRNEFDNTKNQEPGVVNPGFGDTQNSSNQGQQQTNTPTK